MDLGFFRKRERGLAGRSEARLDYAVLVATLEAMQSGSAAARAEVRAVSNGRAPICAQDPLVELILGGAGWRDAIVAQGGCFNAGHAGAAERRRKLK
jgi:hypothetical protein